MEAIEDSGEASQNSKQLGTLNAGTSGATYRSKEMIRVIEKLNHLINFGNLLLLVTGDKGIGKTTLLNEFGCNLGKDFKICFVQADKHIQTQVLFESMIRSFKLPKIDENESFTTHSFQRLLIENAIPEQRVLLIDRAELLLPEVLLQLSHLVIEQRKLEEPQLHIVLFADSALNNVVTETVFHDLGTDGIHHIELRGIRVNEIGMFLQTVAKNSPIKDAPFSEDDFKSIYQASKGHPNRILEECTRHMQQYQGELASSEVPEQEITAESLLLDDPPIDSKRTPIIILAAVSLLAVLGLGYQFVDKSLFSSEPSQVESSWLEKQEPQVVNKPKTSQEVEAATTQAEINEGMNGGNDAPESADSLRKRKVSAKEEGQPSAPEPAVVSADNNRGVEQTIELVNEPIKPNASEPTPDPKPKATTSSDTYVNGVLEKSVEEPEPVKRKNVPVIEQSKRSSKSEESRTLSRFEQDIMQSSDGKVMLQLAGFSKKESAENYIARYTSLKPLGYYQKSLKGDPWYVVVYGDFNNRDEANAAKAELPSVLRKGNPWIKSVEAIKKEMFK